MGTSTITVLLKKKSLPFPPNFTYIQILQKCWGPLSPSCFYDIVLINPVLQRSYLGCLSCCEFKQVTAKSFPEDSISHCSSLTLLILSFFLPLWRHFLHLGVSDMHFPFMAEHSMAIFSLYFDQLWISPATAGHCKKKQFLWSKSWHVILLCKCGCVESSFQGSGEDTPFFIPLQDVGEG